MTYGIPNTAANRSLAATVSSRLRADTMKASATAAFWRLLGGGGLLLLAGGGAGLALFGYSYVTDWRGLAPAIAEAMSKVTLKAEGSVNLTDGGTVKLADGGTVKLSDGSTVRLDAANGTVRLDASGATIPVRLNTTGVTIPIQLDTTGTTVPVRLDTTGATVRLDASGVTMPVPTQPPLRPDVLPPSNVKPVTDYTVFKSVKFADGTVVSGWGFESSTDTRPSRQFCYYTVPSTADPNVSARYNIAKDGAITGNRYDTIFDINVAFSNCVWFQ